MVSAHSVWLVLNLIRMAGFKMITEGAPNRRALRQLGL